MRKKANCRSVNDLTLTEWHLKSQTVSDTKREKTNRNMCVRWHILYICPGYVNYLQHNLHYFHHHFRSFHLEDHAKNQMNECSWDFDCLLQHLHRFPLCGCLIQEFDTWVLKELIPRDDDDDDDDDEEEEKK